MCMCVRERERERERKREKKRELVIKLIKSRTVEIKLFDKLL